MLKEDIHRVHDGEGQDSLQPLDLRPEDGPRAPWRSPRVRASLEGRRWSLVRVAIDALALTLAVVFAGVLTFRGEAPEGAAVIAVYPPLVLAVLASRGVYRVDPYLARLDAVGWVIGGTSVAAMVTIALVSLVTSESSPAFLVGPVWLLASAGLITTSITLEWVRTRARRALISGKPTLIVGAGKVGTQLARRLKQQPHLGLQPIGFLDDYEEDTGEGPLLGHPSELKSLIVATGAEHVLFAFVRAPDSALLPLIRDCEELGVGVSVVPRLFETTTSRMVLAHIGGLPLFALRRVDPKGWQFAIKHLLDCLLAGALLTISAPLMAMLVVAVRLSSPGPIFYRQARIGRDGTEFDMLKFRTMQMGGFPQTQFEVRPGDAPGGVEGQDRRTRVGAVLRRLSLDELPQLVNVVRGEMSLVGPRPERPEYVREFRENVERYMDRHRVKSGITGWAQVHGLRGQTSLADRVEWDNYYIENWSLWLDIKILLMTFIAAFRAAE